MGRIYGDNEMLPFYDCDSLTRELLYPRALEDEVAGWRPRNGDLVRDENDKQITEDGKMYFLQACENLFKPGRRYANIRQIQVVVDSLLALWSTKKVNDSVRYSGLRTTGMKAYFSVCWNWPPILWCMNLSPAKKNGETVNIKLTRSRRVFRIEKKHYSSTLVVTEWEPRAAPGTAPAGVKREDIHGRQYLPGIKREHDDSTNNDTSAGAAPAPAAPDRNASSALARVSVKKEEEDGLASSRKRSVEDAGVDREDAENVVKDMMIDLNRRIGMCTKNPNTLIVRLAHITYRSNRNRVSGDTHQLLSDFARNVNQVWGPLEVPCDVERSIGSGQFS